jgi:drug/metabolite transporter (DMT)-like permease
MTPSANLTMGRTEWILLVALSAIWGASFFFYKVLVGELPPFTIVLGRAALAAILLNVLLVARGQRLPTDAGLWSQFFVIGVLNNVLPFSLIVLGETRISSGLASILNATTPIFALIAAHFLTANEKLNWGKALGVVLGLVGVAILLGPKALGHSGGSDIAGEAFCLAAAVSYAFAGIYGRRFRASSPLVVATGQLTASALLLAPLAAIEAPWRLPGPSIAATSALIALAVLRTALAYLIYFRILARAGATNILLVTLLAPVSAVLLGALFLHEDIGPRAIAGMAVIALGLAAIDGRALRWLMRLEPQRA